MADEKPRQKSKPRKKRGGKKLGGEKRRRESESTARKKRPSAKPKNQRRKPRAKEKLIAARPSASTNRSPSSATARAQRHAQPRADPGGRRRRGQARPDDPRRRREDDRRAAQARSQTDRHAALRAGETRAPGAQETPLVENATHTDAAPPSRAPRKGERLEVEIDSLAFGGRGVARADGFVVFVAGGLPGDRVLAEVTKGKKRFAEARAVELLRAGVRPPPRPLHPRRRALPGRALAGPRLRAPAGREAGPGARSLRRIGGLDGFEMEPIVPAIEAVALPQQARVLVRGGRARIRRRRRRARLPRPRPLGPDRRCRRLQARLRTGNAARNGVREWARMEYVSAYDARAGRAPCATWSSARAGGRDRSRPAW